MTVLEALDRYYHRMAARGDVTPPGWSVEPVGVVIVLGLDGSIVDVFERLDEKGKRGLPMRVPKWFSRQGQGSTPFLFWDNTAYALGVSTKDPGKTQRDHEAFKALHRRVLTGRTDPALVALNRFLEQWTPDQFVAPRFSEKMMAYNVAFQLEGTDRQLIHQRPAAIALCDELRAETAATVTAFCLVSGRRLPVARLHPSVKGVNGAQSSGAALVSFNLEAFTSYGKTQGDNAPTSEAAAFRYGAALNGLLERASRNRLAHGIGDATVVFWADTSAATDEASARAAELFFAAVVEPPDEAEEAKKIRDQLAAVAQGRGLASLDARLDPDTRFHVLGLAPNAARLSVRFWLTDTFGAFVERLAAHHRDLAIEPSPWGERPPSIGRLLVKTTAMQEKYENIPPLLAGEVARAVLAGTRYPRALLAAAIMRLRAGDDAATGWHAAAIKAVLARDARRPRKERNEHDEPQSPQDAKEKPPVSLHRENADPAYQLGRLFAAFETAQRMALGKVNATIRDRYFGAASATPATVFPLLMRGVQNHLGKLRKERKGAWLEREIEEITDRLDDHLPRALSLEKQGRFVLGYYHQRKGQFVGREAEAELATTDAEDDDHDA
ncbi:type I-C CRISPR-associated protein Cas8c/Csd1 [Prosthecomicrobium pneumaticum]|uniref:CRISPR-associated protein Csd1 n=1 Tax=Prosthecomicrobium pneumaticum TaxID=81895 RepID=A0A7W9L2J1_9HYPH|nr:CRISPR-associated protein Csd1 [Prosthecomicrobium pneumaticum]